MTLSKIHCHQALQIFWNKKVRLERIRCQCAAAEIRLTVHHISAYCFLVLQHTSTSAQAPVNVEKKAANAQKSCNQGGVYGEALNIQQLCQCIRREGKCSAATSSVQYSPFSTAGIAESCDWGPRLDSRSWLRAKTKLRTWSRSLPA